MTDLQTAVSHPNRRTFLRNGSLYLLGAGVSLSNIPDLIAAEPNRLTRLGLVTDMHYADKPAAGTRYYRESLAKLEEAGTQFEKDEPDHVVELGDFIDAAESVDLEKGYLTRINQQFASLPGKKHYVLGNHCVHTLTKEEFLGGVGQEKSYYSFDAGDLHCIILDACFRSDGKPYGRKNFKWTDPNIPAAQIEWLQADLKQVKGKAIVFVHQRLDVSNHYGVKNAVQVRRLLEKSGRVLAVFQGHSHKNEVKTINGIHYCVHRAMVEGTGKENSGYSTVDVFDDGTVRMTGFREQEDYEWQA